MQGAEQTRRSRSPDLAQLQQQTVSSQPHSTTVQLPGLDLPHEPAASGRSTVPQGQGPGPSAAAQRAQPSPVGKELAPSPNAPDSSKSKHAEGGHQTRPAGAQPPATLPLQAIEGDSIAAETSSWDAAQPLSPQQASSPGRNLRSDAAQPLADSHQRAQGKQTPAGTQSSTSGPGTRAALEAPQDQQGRSQHLSEIAPETAQSATASHDSTGNHPNDQSRESRSRSPGHQNAPVKYSRAAATGQQLKDIKAARSKEQQPGVRDEDEIPTGVRSDRQHPNPSRSSAKTSKRSRPLHNSTLLPDKTDLDDADEAGLGSSESSPHRRDSGMRRQALPDRASISDASCSGESDEQHDMHASDDHMTPYASGLRSGSREKSRTAQHLMPKPSRGSRENRGRRLAEGAASAGAASSDETGDKPAAHSPAKGRLQGRARQPLRELAARGNQTERDAPMRAGSGNDEGQSARPKGAKPIQVRLGLKIHFPDHVQPAGCKLALPLYSR